jgi:hypothetical protein
MKIGIQVAMVVAILTLAYFVFDSINSRIVFEKETKRRKDVVVERLKDIRTVQFAYKNINGEYAKDFNILTQFIKEGKMPIIKQIGDASDSLQVAMGLVIRDTVYINIADTLFPSSAERLKIFIVDSLSFVPFSNGEKFKLDAGEIEKNKVKVKVFEAFASFAQIYKGLEANQNNVKLQDGLRVGSMTEPSTSGNWE